MIAGGSAVAQGLAVLAAPLLTRIYAPADFGALGAYLATLSLAAVLATLRYEFAVPLPKEDREAAAVVRLALALSLAFAALLALGVLLGWGRLPVWSWALPLGVLFYAWQQALTYWGIRLGAYRDLAAARLWQGVANVLGQLLLGGLRFGTAGLLLADVGGRGLGFLRLFRGLELVISGFDLAELRRVFVRYRKFALWSAPASLINRLGLELPQLFIVFAYGPREAGWYLLTHRTMSLPVGVVGQAVSQVFLNRLAVLRRERPQAAGGFYRRALLQMFLYGGFPILVGGYLLGEAFGWLFGEAWAQAGRMLQILAPAYAAQWTFAPLSQTLTVLERQELQFAWDLARLLGLLGVFAWVELQGLGVFAAVAGISAVLTATYLLLGLLNLYAFRGL